MSSIVHQSKSDGLVVGLNWSVLTSEADSSKQLGARIRKQAHLIGASRHVINTLPQARFIGLYNSPVLATGKLPKRLYSLAMVFVQAFNRNGMDRSTINAILLMKPPGDELRRALVVLEGGQVVYDRLEKADAATAKVQEFTRSTSGINYVVYSDGSDEHEVHATELLTWDQMLTHGAKQAELLAIPKNTAVILGLAGVVALAGAYGIYHYTVIAPAKERARLIAQQAAQNLTPQYLQKLDAELSHVGWNKADLSATLEKLGTQKSYTKGWVLDQVACDVDTQSCIYKFSRLGGEVSELIGIEKDKQYNVDASTKDTAVFSKAIKAVAKSLTRDGLPAFEPASVELRTRAQRLVNAGAMVNTMPSAAWPTGIDMSKVDAKVVVKQSGFEVKTPYVLANTVLSELPDALALRQFVLTLSIGGDKADLLSLTLKGHSYAK